MSDEYFQIVENLHFFPIIRLHKHIKLCFVAGIHRHAYQTHPVNYTRLQYEHMYLKHKHLSYKAILRCSLLRAIHKSSTFCKFVLCQIICTCNPLLLVAYMCDDHCQKTISPTSVTSCQIIRGTNLLKKYSM